MKQSIGILPVIISFVSSVLITPLVGKTAANLEIVAKPNPLVKTHKTATPYLGGVAVYVSMFVGLMFSSAFNSYFSLFLCIGLMMILGLYDDLRPLSPLTKLLGQILISIVGIFLVFNANGGQINLFQFFLYLFWLVLATNAFNLIDVMDGLATGISALAFGGLFLIAGFRGFDDLGIAFLIICAALLGFLPSNFYRARIFLGDAGSLMIGFSFGLLALAEFKFRNQTNTLPIVFLLFAIPFFELVFVFVRRSFAGKHFWKGSRDHFSLRLLSIGWKVPEIVLISYIIGAFLLFIALIFEFLSPLILRWLIMLPAIFLALWIWKYLSKIEVE